MKPTQAKVQRLFDYDEKTGKLKRKVSVSSNARYGDYVGWLNSDGYLNVRIDRRMYKVHQIIWLYVHGSWPVGVIDHINQNKTDSRISNLRDTTIQINNINRVTRKDNKTGIPGVTWRARDSVFYAACKRDGKQNYLGSFKTIDDAAAAVAKFKKSYEIGKEMK